MASKVMKWGNGLGVLLPAFAARSLGLAAGTPVRLLVLDDEIRIRPGTSVVCSHADDSDKASHAEQVREMLSKW